MMGGYERRGVAALERIADAAERLVALLTTEEDNMVYSGPDKTMVTTPADQFYEKDKSLTTPVDDDEVDPLVDETPEETENEE